MTTNPLKFYRLSLIFSSALLEIISNFMEMYGLDSAATSVPNI